jgi:hypothetical protein
LGVDYSCKAKVTAHDLRGERWSQLLAYLIGGERNVVKQEAIRTANVLAMVSGSLGLVDANLGKMFAKAQVSLLLAPLPWQRGSV